MDSLQFGTDSSWKLLAGFACDFVGWGPPRKGKGEEKGDYDEGLHVNQKQIILI